MPTQHTTGGGPFGPPPQSCASRRSVARQLAMRHAMRIRRRLAEARDLILLVRLEVALEPVPLVRMLLGALPRQDVGGDTVEEPAVVSNNNGTAGERQYGVFQLA